MKNICPDRKRNITMRYDISSSLVAAGIPSNPANQKKKLRRLPHVFCRVLELPFSSDVPVVVEENEECFRFVITTDVVFEEVRVQVTEIVPGVTKVVVVGGTNRIRISLDDSEMDLWRFRLPSSTMPEQSSAVYSDGELVIIVPKDAANAFPDEEDNETLIRAREEYLGAVLGILEES